MDPVYKINDNLREIAMHFKAATEFIRTILVDGSTDYKNPSTGTYDMSNAPYQWDFCIAVRECQKTETVIKPEEFEYDEDFQFYRMYINSKHFTVTRKMKISHLIWNAFVDNKIDEMQILKLRKHCREFDEQQIPGLILLNYQRNRIFEHIPSHMKQINWKYHVDQYKKAHAEQIEEKEQKVETFSKDDIHLFCNIMHQYEQMSNDKQSTLKLVELSDKIDEELTMSRVMDILFEVKCGNIFLKNVSSCQWNLRCNVLKRQFLRSRRNKLTQVSDRLSVEQRSKIDLLDLVHAHLYHPDEHHARVPPIDSEEKGISQDTPLQLFTDTLTQLNLISLIAFLNDEDFDSDALFDDMFPDNDAQSNIYNIFKISSPNTMNTFYNFKCDLAKYDINPIDKNATNRNLIDLDFGDHVVAWRIKPNFDNVKQEWLHNEFFAETLDTYETISKKCNILSGTTKNKTEYNLCEDQILCIKMYTDTNELQSNFRHSFRSISDNNRRAQFFHWAVKFHMVYLKIEAENEIHGHNDYISKITLYHGLDRLFDTKGLVRQYYGPLSTTAEETVASTYAGDGGMILQIDKEYNNRNMNAIDVGWISCYGESEVLLLNPHVMIQKSHVFLKDIDMKTEYLKSAILLALMEDPNAFTTLCSFFDSEWIKSCLENVVKDKEFMDRVQLFLPRHCLDDMSLFEFIFFKCQHYQIAVYVDNHYSYDKPLDEIIIGPDSDFFVENHRILKPVNRSNKLCSKYPPTKCKVNIVYDYGKDNKVEKSFEAKRAVQIMAQPSLILKVIDKVSLDNSEHGLQIHVNMNIKYKCSKGLWTTHRDLKLHI
eukprot:325640_1